MDAGTTEILVSILGGVFMPVVVDKLREWLKVTDGKQATALTFLVSFAFGVFVSAVGTNVIDFTSAFYNGLAVYAASQVSFKLGYEKSSFRKDIASGNGKVEDDGSVG